MSFGQSSGPPATGKQLRELTELLEAAGHTDFRDARGPMGFTQRQAGGKFTRDEADAFIEQLEAEVHGDGPPADRRPPAAPARLSKIAPRPANEPSKSKIVPRPASEPSNMGSRAARRASPTPPPADVALDAVPSEALAAELQRRGWAVLEP